MWESLEVLQKLLIANFIALTIHQAEEYGWPGGEPMIMNYALQESDMPDRFPLNQLSAMVTNDLILVLVYFLPIFFPNVIWFGLIGMLFGIMQFFVHGIMTNIKMKGIYNPGLGAVVFLHIPIGCYYLWYVSANGFATSLDWVVGILLTLVAAAVLVGWMTYVIMATRNTKWVFDKKNLLALTWWENWSVEVLRLTILPDKAPITKLLYRKYKKTSSSWVDYGKQEGDDESTIRAPAQCREVTFLIGEGRFH